MSQPQTAMVGTAVTVGSGAYSFFGSTLPMVQWLAAAVGALVGIVTFIHLIKNWNRSK